MATVVPHAAHLLSMFKAEDQFYEDVLGRFIRQGIMHPEDHSVLVVAGAERDRNAFLRHGFKQVTISNLDLRMKGTQYAPYAWSFQDAEYLEFADASFDFCVVHNGLHHCFSPHATLLQMLRVARRGVLFFEPYDNLLTRSGMRFGIGQQFEHAAVFYNDCAYGGVRNTMVPNYVYRFTQREILKTVNCAQPYGPHRFHFIHQMRFPWHQLRGRRRPWALLALLVLWPFLRFSTLCFPKLANCFAAFVQKPNLPRDLYPWLKMQDAKTFVLNQEWLTHRYRPAK